MTRPTSPHDAEEIEIDTDKAVEAYDSFSTERIGSGGKDIAFNSALHAILKPGHGHYPKGYFFLGRKQTISNWRNERPKGPIKKSRTVLEAVYILTGFDISRRSIFSNCAVNCSPMVDLGPITAQKLTNDKGEIKEVLYKLVLSYAVFKSAHMRVMSSWISSPTGEPLDIGTVTYGLRGAHVEAQFGDLEMVDWVRRIPDDRDKTPGRADGCVALWSDPDHGWLVQPQLPGILRARIEKMELATVRGKRGSFANIRITATRDQLDEEFEIRDRNTGGRSELKADERMRARERLISIVLGKEGRTPANLAIHGIKLP